jgi:hypothetical protein
LLTYLELETGAIPATSPATATNRPVLEREIAEAGALCTRADWATDDPLGIGALLTGVFRLAGMMTRHGIAGSGIMIPLVAATGVSLAAYASRNSLGASAESRLAFRELGLAIGYTRSSELTYRVLDDGVREDCQLEALPATCRPH